MSAMHRIRRARHLATAAWRVLTANRSLIAVLVLSYGLALVVATAVFFGGLAILRPDVGGDPTPAVWFVVVAAGIAGTWVASMGQGAVIAGAAQRMDGQEPTVGSAFQPVRRRLWQLFAWAAIATVVTKLLDLLRRRGGSGGEAASSGGKLAWRIVSFVALPVIVFEDVGAVEALKRSTRMLKATWGENLTFNVGLTALGIALLLPLLAGLALAEALGALPLPSAGFLVVLVYGVVAMATYSAVSAVLKTALYRWATDQPVDPAFDDVELGSALGTG